MSDLARRLVACERWDWPDDWIVQEGTCIARGRQLLPDLAGPYAWLWEAWVLKLCREAYDYDVDLKVVNWYGREDSVPSDFAVTHWKDGRGDEVNLGEGDTRIEAAVAALEAAP